MTVRDELLARLYEDMDDIKSWLKSYEEGAVTGRQRGGTWEDTTKMDQQAYERLLESIHQSIQHIEEAKKKGK